MEKQVVITKRFRNNTLRVYQYLLKEFSARTAENFLLQLEQRIDFVSVNPLRLIENNGMKSKDIHLAESIIEENTEVIINRWQEYFGSKIN